MVGTAADRFKAARRPRQAGGEPSLQETPTGSPAAGAAEMKRRDPRQRHASGGHSPFVSCPAFYSTRSDLQPAPIAATMIASHSDAAQQ